MARGKYKITRFLRFFIFLFVFIPAVLAGVSFYKFGKVNMDSIKDVLSNQSIERTSEAKIQDLENDIRKLEAKIDDKRDEINKLEGK